MASPFPGMDPYLEDATLWPAFQYAIIENVRSTLLTGPTDRYRALIHERCYQAQTEQRELYLGICLRDGGKLVTQIDVVSPTNKTTDIGRQEYLSTRKQGRETNANLVEIDLVLQGKPTLEYSRDGLPEWDYAVTATRATQPDRYEIYTSTLQKRLPRFRLPLSSDDRDTVLDLQTIFERSYDQVGCPKLIDYGQEPAVPLGDEDRRSLESILIGKGIWQPLPPHEDIARAAYSLWEEHGRQHGRDQEHWHKAVTQMRRPKR